jgi:hypothetical protein
MFDSSPVSTAPRYGASAAFLSMALLVCALIASGPAGYASLSLALAGSVSCVIAARIALAKWPISSIAKTGRARGVLALALGAGLTCMPGLIAGDLSGYRGLQFGMSVADAATHVGKKAADARLVHQRPALIQEIDWQPASSVLDTADADPVQNALLCFYNGELFRIVVTYDRYKVAGMTAEDMIEALSEDYGTAARPKAEIPYHSFYGEAAAVLARWEDAGQAANLVRTGDGSSFAMVFSSKRLDALAQASIAEAVRIDTKEAPLRELEAQKKRDEDERLALEKTRSMNKSNFRP